MIGSIIHLKLRGRHIKAFRKFCLRVCAYNTKEGARLLVEELPEYKSLIRDVNPQDNKNNRISQA